MDQLGAKSDFIDGCCAPATSGRVFLFQQGLAIDEMGFGGQLHGSNFEPLMSALGQKQTFTPVNLMSALPPKADIGTRPRNVRFVPKADMAATSALR